jgi:murein DD-endopeptidase MepM/ murein hydrolase activator NlpD
MRYHPVLHYWRLHAGRDYAANCGSPVHAAASGTIISAGVAGGYGNQLVVDHGVHSGVSLATTYNHLSSFARTGGRVGRGQVIGYVGTTGTSTGCHLHFETREDGNPVDPRKWL